MNNLFKSIFKSITRSLLRSKPPGWMDHLRKYLTDDGLFLGDFQRQTGPRNDNVVLNMKMINFRGDMILKVFRIMSVPFWIRTTCASL